MRELIDALAADPWLAWAAVFTLVGWVVLLAAVLL
jgi:hypothetical protein